MTTTRRPPRDLGVEGRKLWAAVTAELAEDELVPSASEYRYLLDSCREADVIAGIQAAFEGQPHVVKGSQGQPVAHPLLAELRQHRATLAQLLARLKYEPPDAGKQHRWDSTDARAAAQARWAAR